MSGNTRELVLATRSTGKLQELVPMVREVGFRSVTLEQLGIAETPDEDAIEAFGTFEENARAKARWFATRAAGRLVLADDSGLSVDVLGGAPGVRSKRWAEASGVSTAMVDEANNNKLLAELHGQANRRASYVCVVVIADAGTVDVMARGECTGRIVNAPRGNSGFGYDTLFYSDELGVTFGEADAHAKAIVSHRGRAVRSALERLSSYK